MKDTYFNIRTGGKKVVPEARCGCGKKIKNCQYPNCPMGQEGKK